MANKQVNTKVSADSERSKQDKGGTTRTGKSGKAMAKPKSVGYAKTNAKYWEQKVFKPTYVKDGIRKEAKHYAARIAHKHERHTFPLGTGSQAAAGKEAAKIYLCLLANGWEATREKYAPSYVPKSKRTATVGEYITEAQAVAEVPADTLAGYIASFRSIVTDIARISSIVTVEEGKRILDEKTGKNRIVKVKRKKDIRYDYASGAGEKWRAKVDAVSLESITPAKVQKWKLNYVRSVAGDDLEKERKAKNSANSKMRQAKGLFSEKIHTHVSRTLTLPDELPFNGVKPFPRQSMRYVSKISLPELISAAVDTLAESEPESFKIFLLASMAGLRADEIDTLLWRQIDFEAGKISIEATPYFRPKSEDSIGEVEIELQAVEILRGFHAKAKGEFVIESNRPPKQRRGRERRAKKEFAATIAWLKSQGVKAQKPIHELRKEFGSLVCQRGGIYAASRALRHADVAITAAHYLDNKEPVTVGLGAFLSGEQEPEGDNVTPIEEGREEAV